jgi:hypothetical protein
MDIKLIFALAALATILIAIVPYVLDILRGRTKPHIYTWLVWTVTGGIGVAALLHGNGGYPLISMSVGTLICFTVFLLSFKYGTRDITLGDTLALLTCAAAVFVWVGLNHPLWSVIIGVSIDIIAYWPTVRKTFNEPWSESLFPWFLWILAPAFSLLGLSSYNVFTLILYVPVLIVNIAFVVFCVLRRKTIPRPA